ncbi:hypothetical protein VFPPC_15364 [Pochonia chlamydosporia 170]|uniref:Uncharacterized protein n=1 Tax=Pochonia chlamydosporia 170 TaxID=1380566 RepID=A0A179G8P5_METCM|nr:hypothetical protein VFPPC_15364 [Pochonia chlamydosporia 170]OAQ73791.1 hypothetical protein VFPPC_15364 [Pochonia chlamydosporia 170]
MHPARGARESSILLPISQELSSISLIDSRTGLLAIGDKRLQCFTVHCFVMRAGSSIVGEGRRLPGPVYLLQLPKSGTSSYPGLGG